MISKIKKEETTPFSTRMKVSLKKALVEYCDREGVNIIRLVEDAVIAELEKRRNGKAK